MIIDRATKQQQQQIKKDKKKITIMNVKEFPGGCFFFQQFIISEKYMVLLTGCYVLKRMKAYFN